ncbi:Quinate repressor protein [Cyphellophora attinorum]|uniref:Quinate repressor protein n=1 Tax=Cyphellophora attinorum TaxID=1664694 RepID=A0A0N1H4Z0_9EURO|nr:Quinate repressor protein [Phialophora attinorum]KPI35917.1 Quinate repressor protein [Phialophora attinorum]
MTKDARAFTSRQYESGASIALVGLRGVGKRSLGFIAAAHLQRRFVSEGLYFEHVTGAKKSAYISLHGQDEFHRRSDDVLEQMLAKYSQDCVLDCGIATLTANGRAILRHFAQTHPVVHITRDFDHIPGIASLTPAQKLQLQQCDLRHRSCSNFEYFNLEDVNAKRGQSQGTSPDAATTLRRTKEDIQNFVDFITGQQRFPGSGPFSLSAVPIESRRQSFVTSGSLSAFSRAVDLEVQQDSGEDAFELVVDTLHESSTSHLAGTIARLRRGLKVPIILSLSTTPITGEQTVDEVFNLLQVLLRHGVEYLTVPVSIDDSHLRALVANRGATKLIGTVHIDTSAPGAWSDPGRNNICQRAQQLELDAVRLTQPAVNHQDNDDLYNFLTHIRHTTDIIVTAHNTGLLGRSSRISCRTMTPVRQFSQASLAFSELDPESQVTIADINSALFASFKMDPLRFYILGESVSYSCSPPMYNAAFELYGLRHTFDHKDVAAFEQLLETASAASFGGSAISFPFKEQAYRACTATSPHASIIGSVNTIIPLRSGVGPALGEHAENRNRAGQVSGLYGDNSDWYSIFINVWNKLSPHNAARLDRATALLLGAGGSARSALYALLQLGIGEVCVLNRTRERAADMTKHFQEWCDRTNKRRRSSYWIIITSGLGLKPQPLSSTASHQMCGWQITNLGKRVDSCLWNGLITRVVALQ